MSEANDLKAEIWELDLLIPYEKNAKKHPKEQVAKIAASIEQFGWPQAKAIEIDQNGVIINGHGRRLAALSLGMTKVPVVVRSDLSEAEVRAYRLADNEVSHSEYDTALLADELTEIMDSKIFDMSLFFDARDLDFATDDLGEMNLDELTADIQEEVEGQRQDIAEKAEQSKGKKFDLHEAFGFKKITNEQRLTLVRLMTVAEQTTGENGPAALVQYVKEHCL